MIALASGSTSGQSALVSLPARKSSQFSVHMVRDDEVALDGAIDCRSFGALWESSGPGRWTPTYHESMLDALDAGGGVQAFLRLVGPDGPSGPIVQYLSGWRGDLSELRAGRVAYLWFPADTDPSEGAAFQSLADGFFRAIRTVTKPHVVTHEGKPVRGYRIGVHAIRWYMEHPWPERVLRDMASFATYRLSSEELGDPDP